MYYVTTTLLFILFNLIKFYECIIRWSDFVKSFDRVDFSLILFSVFFKNKMQHCHCQNVIGTFFYFAYGSNLLKKRIRINNPSSEFVGIGKLTVSNSIST